MEEFCAFSVEHSEGKYTFRRYDTSRFNSLDEFEDWYYNDGNDDKYEYVCIPWEEVKETFLVLEYNGERFGYLYTWEDIEGEFEDTVVEALKADGEFHEIEYADDPDDDDECTDIYVFKPAFVD